MHSCLTPPPSSPYMPHLIPMSLQFNDQAGPNPVSGPTPKPPHTDCGEARFSLPIGHDKSRKSQGSLLESLSYAEHVSDDDGDLVEIPALPVSPPPIVHRLPTYAKHACTKFTPYLKPQGPSSLELRFTEKSMGRINNDDFTLDDPQAGRSIFIHGLMGLSKGAFDLALAAKEADHETKRFHALATAWEIEALERKRSLLLTAQKENVSKFFESTKDLEFFHKLLEDRSITELEDNSDFNLGAYRHGLTALSVEEEHLNQMREASNKHSRSVTIGATVPESGDCLAAILARSLPSDEE
ncbi:hypothetical protein PAXRUDRAFT_21055 [Paxillus rubicundulus Ve08.2h10]|uniref:Unplaced genomic scaffold scaffold_5118, whole genome shotgun sequence n=1 Tax=Paxillus rubicundulus Ve08.2h10 TaxID=930991 RepID=A0A0D0D864_9AGAM|nr:hypothetical protein PAXRUDRAFT_21055 [Paxillus rubicundulus Ve08.2h10]